LRSSGWGAILGIKGRRGLPCGHEIAFGLVRQNGIIAKPNTFRPYPDGAQKATHSQQAKIHNKIAQRRNHRNPALGL
jgi:hypothetical protein